MSAPVRVVLRVGTKAELSAALERLVSDPTGIRHAAWGSVDCLESYKRNVKEHAAVPLLPGFAPEGIAKDPACALSDFKHFCRSQFGQRRCFLFSFGTIAAPSRSGRALAGFDGSQFGADYLTLHEGASLTSATPPCEPEGWSFGALADGSQGWFPPTFVMWVS
jgi:hypothetical protein